jgi:hypothetical protein
LDVFIVDVAAKKPLERVDNVLIQVNNNHVPVDFVFLNIECNASCPIILGRPFVRTAGAIIDMRDGIIRYQFSLKKGNNARLTGSLFTGKCYGLNWKQWIDPKQIRCRDFRIVSLQLKPT